MSRSMRVTIMFTDVAGSTELLEQLGDRAGTELLRRHFTALRRSVAKHGGREVKMLGDGLMVVFVDPAAAASCATAMQRSVARHNRRVDSTPLGLRIGLHAGEAVQDSGDFFGLAVVIAKRLCDRCEAGQVIASSTVSELCRGADRPFDQLRSLSLKGIAVPVPASVMRWSDSALRTVSIEESLEVAAG